MRKRVSRRPWADPDDAPLLTRKWFANADLHDGTRLLRKAGRSRKAVPKETVSLRLDPDVLAHFRAGGPGWQSRINEVLRKAARL